MDKIKALLHLFEAKSENNYSLHNGKTGLSLCYFILFSLTKIEAYEIKAKELIDQMSENIALIEDLPFADGLAGIGWAVEWLVQHNYIIANTDEILDDLDHELYKSIVYAKASNLSLETGTIGKAMYYFRRKTAKNPGRQRFLEICNDECLILLIDEINETFNDDEIGYFFIKEELKEGQLIDIAQSLLFLSKIHSHKVSTEITINLICSIIFYLENYFSIFQYNECSEGGTYLLYAYLKAGVILKDASWIENSKTLFFTNYLNRPPSPEDSFRHRYIYLKLCDYFEVNYNDNLSLGASENIFSILTSIDRAFPNHKIEWEESWIL